MNLLALDTATEACSVALQTGRQICVRFDVAGRSHTQQLVPMVRAVMAEAGIGFAQLDGYVCGTGPGSFAGVRIGVSFIKGLALAHDRPVVPVSSLRMLALPPMRDGAQRVLTAIDARMDEVYFAAWQRDADGLPEAIGEAVVSAPADVPAQAGAWHAVGSGWQAYRAALEASSAATLLACDGQALPRAADALALAQPCFANGRVIGAAELVPQYLRNKVALTLIEQRARRAMPT
ncbi:tRNA (adenosine(37)-N6)-threonylcarbamoyltransferase complex dimerization subunit type 1 TsaB [Solimonas terrae]|uniref:tRNA threonylcarbamoyladenosine biosynthesis protein TsaB n=1 Tax=Solimonas terrae TaxID=1396819 RepID=A0A6M2BUE3_9GAMM|nr:tRNA (adenosine(37)-N6)-threonylcarbamoyltransferase complex dimerization subunit type 1 TsaB [Solimonas terrae]NGY06108.1 tRNA (adenosine(37)-N6)-threonylcarbamoyltransferase complex dimerization subunit type 1 TsaB [Solimonas terrae]